jgi:glutamate/tyrosine decarboxylase-like PLP-dependent enzyme
VSTTPQPLPSGPDRLEGAAPASRMHDQSEETSAIVELVLDYSRRRILADNIPLDKAMTAPELVRLAGNAISEEGLGARRALGLFEHVLAPACISVDHPGFVSFIPAAPTKASIAFDLVVSASAIYGGSWMEGSGAIHAENEVLAFLAAEFGLPPEAGGVFVQGGTVGNLSALVAARHHARATRKARGLAQPDEWVILSGESTHSSVASAAAVMDVRVVRVPADSEGRLSGPGVELALQEHKDSVFAVVATAGSTNLGIVDDIASIAALKDEHEFWLHVDGAYGLAAILVPEMRATFEGVGRADSVIVDPHKWLFAPFDACALIYRDPAAARAAHRQSASYLDPLNEAEDWNPSDLSFQLTRRPRGLPLWFSLATYGVAEYRRSIAASLDLARAIADEIETRPSLRLIRRPDLSVVAFERIGWAADDYARWSAALLDDQRAFVMPSAHEGAPILRFAVLNPRTSVELLVAILDTID